MPDELNPRVSTDPKICHGKLVVRVTRVMVSTILGALGAGDSIEDVLRDYPSITEEDIRAALLLASELARFGS